MGLSLAVAAEAQERSQVLVTREADRLADELDTNRLHVPVAPTDREAVVAAARRLLAEASEIRSQRSALEGAQLLMAAAVAADLVVLARVARLGPAQYGPDGEATPFVGLRLEVVETLKGVARRELEMPWWVGFPQQQGQSHCAPKLVEGRVYGFLFRERGERLLLYDDNSILPRDPRGNLSRPNLRFSPAALKAAIPQAEVERR